MIEGEFKMIMYFSREEKKWLVMEPLNWHIQEGCPEEIREKLEQKLKALDDYRRKLESMLDDDQ